AGQNVLGGEVEPVDMGEIVTAPDGAIVRRADEIEVTAPIGEIFVRDVAFPAIGIGNALEPGDEIAIADPPEAAIERPAAERRIVAINDAMHGVTGWPGRVLAIDGHGGASGCPGAIVPGARLAFRGT